MDLEKTKKHYDWDPSSGDYSKSDVSYERRMLKRKENRNLILVIVYVIALVAVIYFVWDNL